MHAFPPRELLLETAWEHESRLSAAERFRLGSLSRKGGGWLRCESCGQVYEVLAVQVWERRGVDGRTHHGLRCPTACCAAGIRQWRPSSAIEAASNVAPAQSPIARVLRFAGES